MLGTRTKTARCHFTKDAINRIKPPASGRIYIFDEKARGLALCITSTGTRTFYYCRKSNGVTQRVRLDVWPNMTVEQARRDVASYSGAVADGKNPAAAQRVKRNAPMLGEVFDLFIELPTRTKAKRPKSAVTVTGYRQQFNSCLADWKDRRLSTISRNDIERLHNRIADESGQFMANRVLGLLKTLFNTAIDQDVYNVNPASRVRAFEEESRERFLQADELPRFFEALDEEPSEKVRDFIKIALFTGQRRMNCLQMKWADIHLDRGLWTIPQTKSGRHVVPLTDEALKVLRRRLEDRGDSEYVFPGLHDRSHLKDPMRQWREILKRAGIEDLHLHDLRRSISSWAATTGASLSVIGKMLGHSRPDTTAIYARIAPQTVRDSMDTAISAMLAAGESKAPGRKTARNGKA